MIYVVVIYFQPDIHFTCLFNKSSKTSKFVTYCPGHGKNTVFIIESTVKKCHFYWPQIYHPNLSQEYRYLLQNTLKKVLIFRQKQAQKWHSPHTFFSSFFHIPQILGVFYTWYFTLLMSKSRFFHFSLNLVSDILHLSNFSKISTFFAQISKILKKFKTVSLHTLQVRLVHL